MRDKENWDHFDPKLWVRPILFNVHPEEAELNGDAYPPGFEYGQTSRHSVINHNLENISVGV